jgi:hypothetical protein
MCSPSESLLRNSIGAVSFSFPISRFQTQYPTQYYILHRDCILYLNVKIYMIQSNKYGSVQHETGKWGSQVGKAGGRKAQCRSAGSMSRSHRMCLTLTSSLSWSVRSSNSSQGSSPP